MKIYLIRRNVNMQSRFKFIFSFYTNNESETRDAIHWNIYIINNINVYNISVPQILVSTPECIDDQ